MRRIYTWGILMLLAMACAEFIHAQPKQISPDSIIAVNSHGNYLYMGVGNEISIVLHSKPAGKLHVTSNNGSVSYRKPYFIINPDKSGRVEIKVFSNDKELYSQELQVFSLPEPQIRFGEFFLTSSDAIAKDDLLQDYEFNIYFSDDIKKYDKFMKIQEVELGYEDRAGLYTSIINDGNKLSEELKSKINNFVVGKRVSFKVRVLCNDDIKILPIHVARIY